MLDRLRNYIYLTRLHRPIGIFLVGWPMLWALWLAAEGPPDPRILLVFVAGAVLMRSAGCAINDYADREIDPYVHRTKDRPLATGVVSEKEAVILFAVLSLIAFGLVLTLNWLTIALSFGGAALAALYPFTKRYTHFPQVVLGVAFAWAVPMAFAAQTGGVPAAAWLVFLATVVWAVVYDTMYAMADRKDDLEIGVKSTAVFTGEYDLVFILGFELLFYASLIAVGIAFGLGAAYYIGLCAAAVQSLRHMGMIQNRDPAECFKAFLDNNWVGMTVFIGIALDFYLRAG